ncbi:hypothetical protein BLAT2472_20330 [Burkholderia latens]
MTTCRPAGAASVCLAHPSRIRLRRAGPGELQSQGMHGRALRADQTGAVGRFDSGVVRSLNDMTRIRRERFLFVVFIDICHARAGGATSRLGHGR